MRGLISNVIKQKLGRHRWYSHGSLAGSIDLGGVFVPIPTPYQSNGNVDYGALAANFERWEKIPFKGESII